MIGTALQHFTETILSKKTTIMSVASATGVLATFIFTILANKKAENLRKSAEERKGDILTPIEQIKAEAPAYILPACIAVATIGVIAGNEAVHQEEKSKLLESAALAGSLYYNRIAAEKNAGVEEAVSAQIVDEYKTPKKIPDGWACYYDSFRKKYFVEKPENVLAAALELQRVFAYEGQASANVYYRALKNPVVPPSEELELIGWSKWHTTRVDISPPLFIDILYELVPNRFSGISEECTVIDFMQPPEENYMNDL